MFGVNNNGTQSQHDITDLANLAVKDGFNVFALIISHTVTPIVFSKPGTYEVAPSKQKVAFSQGTVYFRHGAKSEPANSKDLSDFLDRRVETTRKSWLGNIRKVIEAPQGYKVKVLPPEVTESSSVTATPIRIVDDPSAPAYRKIDPDTTHPHRLKEVVQLVNQKLRGGRRMSAYTVQTIRRAHDIDSKSQYFYHSKFASPQYSDAFVDWLVDNIDRDPEFFERARHSA